MDQQYPDTDPQRSCYWVGRKNGKIQNTALVAVSTNQIEIPNHHLALVSSGEIVPTIPAIKNYIVPVSIFIKSNMRKFLLLLLLPATAFSQQFTQQEMNGWQERASHVSIIRDNWGIPHIYGKTDADAVFGLMYAQCEDNFQRVERNYLEVMGRLAEIDGPSKLYDDLKMKLIYDTSAAKKDYTGSPAWLVSLLNAFADGVNFYLARHPETHPALLKRFEPWFPLLFTDGSISATQTGGLTDQDVRSLYFPGRSPAATMANNSRSIQFEEYSGSNGFAIAPSRTASGHALLYINPHVTFYFRTEVQVVSEEGLNAYGAVTWGQFFVYQGFNAHLGWMHTTSYADVADLYEEKTLQQGDSLFYLYDGQKKPVGTRPVTLWYRKDNGKSQLSLTAYYTHHGPVMGSRNGHWLSLKEHNRSLDALMQSWLRTKAANFGEFRHVMDMRSNNSNNTTYADDKGNIAYWHGNFMPVRDTSFDWSQPVDGSIAATEWKGLHELDQTVHIYNPGSGWIENCNSTPFTASGESSPKKKDYPAYMAPDGQNARAVNAIRLLSREHAFTLDKLIAAGYDHYLSAFSVLLPALFNAYMGLDGADTAKRALADVMQELQSWNMYSSQQSVATTLAVMWGNKMLQRLPQLRGNSRENDQMVLLRMLAQKVSPKDQTQWLLETVQDLNKTYGSWKVAWGDINRYQRTTGLPEETFSDDRPSLPVGMTSSRWGSIPAFESRPYQHSKKQYGLSGNSFIAAVEFGEKVTARSVVTGGESSDPASKHFTDQAELFIEGRFKEVLFYKEDVLKHAEKTYRPGE